MQMSLNFSEYKIAVGASLIFYNQYKISEDLAVGTVLSVVGRLVLLPDPLRY